MAPATTHTTWRVADRQPQPRPAQLRADDDSTYQSRLTSSYDNGLTNIARLQQLYRTAAAMRWPLPRCRSTSKVSVPAMTPTTI
jgi:hypothetical protein